MSARIVHIALNTFREAVRDRVLYNLIAFALLMSGAAILVGQISIGIERLVVVNLGLTAVSLFGVVIAIFIGIGLVSKEIEKRTLYTVLSRPVQRWEFIVGKFFGLAGTLVVNTFFMAIGVFVALLYVCHRFQAADGLGAGGSLFYRSAISDHYCVHPAVFIVFFAAAVRGLCSIAVHHRQLCRRTCAASRPWPKGPPGGWRLRRAYLVPNFSSLNVISSVAHGQPVAAQLILSNTALCPALCRHGRVRRGRHLRASKSQMSLPAASP